MAETHNLMWDKELLAKLDRFLHEFPGRVFANELGKACTKGMKPILEEAKALVTKRSGLLRKSLGYRQKKYGGRKSSRGDAGEAGYIYTIVGPRKGFKDPDTGENPVSIAHLVEYGTGPHLIAPKGKAGALAIKRGVGPTVLVEGAVHHPGARPRPFLRPAYFKHRQRVLDIVGVELGAGIARQAESLRWTP